MMPIGLETLPSLIAGLLLFAASFYLERRYHGTPPFLIKALYFSGFVITLVTLLYRYRYLDPLIFTFTVALLFPAMWLTGKWLAGLFSHAFVSFLYESKPATPMPSDFSLAKSQADRGDITGALDTYWGYFHEHPKRSRALFAGAAVAEGAGRYEDAVAFYEAIIDFFVKDRMVWADASLRLANVYANHLRDTATANTLLTTLIEEAPDLAQARIAEKIMKRRTVAPH